MRSLRACSQRLRHVMRRPGGSGLARQLLLAVFLVSVPATLLLGVVMLSSLASLGSVNTRLAQIAMSVQRTRDLQFALVEAADHVEEYLLTGDRRHGREFRRSLAAARASAATCASETCHSSSRRPLDMERALHPAVDRLERVAAEAFAIPDLTAGSQRPLHLTGVHAALADINQRLSPMLDVLQDRVADLGREEHAASVNAYILSSALTAGIVLLACGTAILVSRRITSPLRDLLLATRRVMGGERNHRVPVGGPGEFRELASSFNAMVDEVRTTDERLKEANRTLEQRVRDRTAELQTTEQALAQAEKLASLGLLAAGVAHELNNPLTSVVMNTHLLMEEVGPDSPLHAELKRIDADATRCRRIIEDLHVFARRGELDRVPSPVAEVVEQALWSARPELHARHIHVETHIPPDMPEVVWDPIRITQVLTNLVLNAAQAMEHGGTLAVRAHGDGREIVVEVQDSGPGIPAAHRSKVFDPFFTTKSYGTGLGLSICHGIVAKHGGRIDLDTRTREDVGPDGVTGTTFRLVLPAREGSW